jgi:hypothetical protein
LVGAEVVGAGIVSSDVGAEVGIALVGAGVSLCSAAFTGVVVALVGAEV